MALAAHEPPPDRSDPRRGLFRKRRNRRVPVVNAVVSVWIADAIAALGRKLLVAGKALLTVALVAAALYGGRWAVRHVTASPRFALRAIHLSPTDHVTPEEIVSLGEVAPGDRLLALDTDSIAARIATHPWLASARVRRELPSALAIDVIERRAVAAALLGTLYLVDVSGHPFKRATLEEAEGLPVLTGVTREQYAAYPAATQAAYAEALQLLAAYEDRGPEGGQGRAARPALSEIRIDTRYGFALVFLEGGGEVRLGRGDWKAKLLRLDQILAVLAPPGPQVLRVVHLDGPDRGRIALRMSPAPGDDSGPGGPGTTKKFRSAPKRGED